MGRRWRVRRLHDRERLRGPKARKLRSPNALEVAPNPSGEAGQGDCWASCRIMALNCGMLSSSPAAFTEAASMFAGDPAN